MSYYHSPSPHPTPQRGEGENGERKKARGRRGAVLILVFVIMVTLTAIIASFLHMCTIQTRRRGFDIRDAKALWIADGGLQKVFYTLKNDTNYQTNPATISGSLGDGTYSVTCTKNGSNYNFTSTGTVSGLNRKITQIAVLTQGAPQAFNYIQQSGTDINFNNSGGTVTGNLKAGGEVKNESGMTINGTITEGSSVTTPSVDFASYAAIADNTVNGNKTFQEGQTYTGIWYVAGNVTIQEEVTINGSIIATGNISMDNAEEVAITPTSPYPALVSGNNITGTNMEDSAISGLIYATNNMTLNNIEDLTFNGTMIAGGKIDIKNGEGLNLTYNSGIQANPPPYFSGGGTTTVTPQKDWDEVIPA